MKETNHKVWESDATTLNTVWQNWNCQVENQNHAYAICYTDVIRWTQRAQRFEDWLYEHGALVIQKNNRRFLRFHKEDDAIMFMLRWG